jgi:DNA-binding PadR family transcriptional regulator|nr:hypothetical protein [Acutalibacter muris]
MDKFSRKLLKYIDKQKLVSANTLKSKYGQSVRVYLGYLHMDDFISESWEYVSKDKCDYVYRTTPKGKAFLEENPGKRFDTWLTRIIAIWGAITGTIALVLELLSRFQ